MSADVTEDPADAPKKKKKGLGSFSRCNAILYEAIISAPGIIC